MKRLAFLIVAGALLTAAPAYANNPNHMAGCHGANNVPCRPDPQPTHGNDCKNSDDHSCEVSTSTTTTAPLSITTTSLPTNTTTTTTHVVSPSPITSTTTDSDTTITVSPLTISDPAPAPAVSKTAPVQPGSLTPPIPTPIVTPTATTELAQTGAGTDILIGLGLWLLVGGAVAMLLGKIIKG